jgi:NADH-quinone oxidoreductase subunit N
MPTALLHFVRRRPGPRPVAARHPRRRGPILHGWLAIDKMALFLEATVASAAASRRSSRAATSPSTSIDRGEYYPLLLQHRGRLPARVAPTTCSCSSSAWRPCRLGVYAMTGFRRGSARSAEAALKYFLLGSFAAAMLLMGAALLYAVTGHTDFPGIANVLHPATPVSPRRERRQRPAPGDAAHPRGHPVDGARARGDGLQGGRRALPHVDPRRLRGRAHQHHLAYMSVVVKAAAFGALVRVILAVFGDAGSSAGGGGLAQHARHPRGRSP